jgi:hypothetical protein
MAQAVHRHPQDRDRLVGIESHVDEELRKDTASPSARNSAPCLSGLARNFGDVFVGAIMRRA